MKRSVFKQDICFVFRVWDTIQSNLIPRSLSGKPISVRCASLEAFALGCFIIEDDFFAIRDAMSAFRDLWKHAHPNIKTASLRGWTLMLSSLTSMMFASCDFTSDMETLRSLLDSEQSDVQQAAGMAVALLCTLGMEGDEEIEETDSLSMSTNANQMETLACMKDLSEARGPRLGKKQRASQKAAFRNLCNFIENGYVRETKIKLQYGDVLTLTSLQKHIQMDYLRSVFGSGFHRHLHENSIMHVVFGYHPRTGFETKSSTSDKKYTKSPHAWSRKIRNQTRDWERSQKQVYLQSGY